MALSKPCRKGDIYGGNSWASTVFQPAEGITFETKGATGGFVLTVNFSTSANSVIFLTTNAPGTDDDAVNGIRDMVATEHVLHTLPEIAASATASDLFKTGPVSYLNETFTTSGNNMFTSSVNVCTGEVVMTGEVSAWSLYDIPGITPTAVDDSIDRIDAKFTVVQVSEVQPGYPAAGYDRQDKVFMGTFHINKVSGDVRAFQAIEALPEYLGFDESGRAVWSGGARWANDNITIEDVRMAPGPAAGRLDVEYGDNVMSYTFTTDRPVDRLFGHLTVFGNQYQNGVVLSEGFHQSKFADVAREVLGLQSLGFQARQDNYVGFTEMTALDHSLTGLVTGEHYLGFLCSVESDEAHAEFVDFVVETTAYGGKTWTMKGDLKGNSLFYDNGDIDTYPGYDDKKHHGFVNGSQTLAVVPGWLFEEGGQDFVTTLTVKLTPANDEHGRNLVGDDGTKCTEDCTTTVEIRMVMRSPSVEEGFWEASPTDPFVEQGDGDLSDWGVDRDLTLFGNSFVDVLAAAGLAVMLLGLALFAIKRKIANATVVDNTNNGGNVFTTAVVTASAPTASV